MKKILITYAVEGEFIPLSIGGSEIITVRTEIGKAKSAHLLTRKIIEEKPDVILNIGTAGTLEHQVGDVFVVTRFVDRDFESIKLPGVDYEIDGAKLLQNMASLKKWISEYHKKGVCSTGDTFVMEATSFTGDVVDMEAYAQALVCEQMQVPFVSVKYITDVIGENSIEHWENKLADARLHLSEWFAEHKLLSVIALDLQ